MEGRLEILQIKNSQILYIFPMIDHLQNVLKKFRSRFKEQLGGLQISGSNQYANLELKIKIHLKINQKICLPYY